MYRETRNRDNRCRYRSARPQRVRTQAIESLERRELLTTITLFPQQDTTLFEDNAGALANGAGEHFFAGTAAPRNNDLVRRGLLAFDLSEIPSGASVDSVSLTLNMSRTIAGAEPVSLHFMLNSWGEGTSAAGGEEGQGTNPETGDATWIHRRFATENWDSPGGDFLAARSARVDVDGPGKYTWTDPGMILDVEHWLQNPDENFGWIVVGNEDASTTAKRFDSRENPVEANRPALTVDFISSIPSLSIGEATVAEGDFGTRTLNFPVSISQSPTQDVTVQVATADGSATAGSDYQPVNGAITFTPGGPLSQDVTVLVIGDTLTEADETLTMSLTAPNDVFIENGEAIGTITNDDPEPEIIIRDASVEEEDTGSSTAAWTVELSHATAFEVTVDYATLSGTAEEGTDFSATTGTLTFPPGETSQRIEVDIIGDTESEPDETFSVQLSNVSNAQLTNDTASMLIVDNDSNGALPSLSVSNAEAVEGDQETTALNFVVTISEAPASEVSVEFSTADGTATEGIDYEAVSDILSFAPDGPLTREITVNIIGDFVTETDETFTLTLANAIGARIENGQAEGTIINDDPEPEVVISDSSLAEGDSGASFVTLTVELSRPTALAVTVDYTTEPGTAAAGEDFTTTSGQLNFAPGVTFQTVEVSVHGDTEVEPDETFVVRLSSALNARLTEANSAVVTIVNDDDEVVQSPWHNQDLPEDVTGDGLVVPLDALRVINWLNSVGSGALPAPTPDNEPPPFLDVNGDNQVSPIDALRVINLLNQQSPLAALAAAHSTSAAARRVDALFAELAAATIGLDDRA